jgi:ethanolamine utilization protein
MAIDDLVQTIVQEVIRRLQGEAASQKVLILAREDDTRIAPVLRHLDQGDKAVFWNKESDSLVPARTIIPFVSCSQMADLAQGRATGPLLKKALDLLLAGKVVEVFEFEYLQYEKSAPESLYQLYASYEETLRGYGLQRFAVEEQNVARFSRRLVTERDIIEAHQQGISVLRVLSDAQLTPLALDCARERGIQLQKTER